MSAAFACVLCDTVQRFAGKWKEGDVINTSCFDPNCPSQTLVFWKNIPEAAAQ